MTIRKRCNEGSCTNGRKCLEHLRFDVMWRGKRFRMPANDFAIPRMELGKQRLWVANSQSCLSLANSRLGRKLRLV
jgi:hypothetical protein